MIEASKRTVPQRRIDSLRSLVRRLVEPSQTLHPGQLRRARFLSWLLLALMGPTALSVVVAALSIPPDDTRGGFYVALDVAVLAVFALAYWQNWRGHYAVAAGMVVSCAALGVWSSILLDPAILNRDEVPLLFTAFTVLLCSLLLSPRTTTLLAIGQLALLVVVLRLNAGHLAYDPFTLVLYYGFSSALCIVANVVSQQDMRQIEQQASQLAANAALLQEQSVRDGLTGLYNRRFLDEVLPHELSRAARSGRPLAVMMIDLDGFKTINDTFGHARGDALLRDFALLLRRYIRQTDYACRYGGDEFVVMLPEAPLDIASSRAELLRARLSDAHLAVSNPEPALSISIGIAIAPASGQTSEAILASADVALYQAKRAGRNRVVVSAAAGLPNELPGARA